tara:strand:- start:629 stop:889 length:261 start_codon:yes stop_codon:yes gene_type:complete
MKTITVTLNKKTIQSAYSEMKLLKMIGAGYAQGDSPMIKLLKEIKRDVNKQHKQKMSGWKEFFHFWPLSIMVPLMLLSIILGPLFQ